MNVAIKDMPEFTVVGLSLQTLPKSPEISKLWDSFVPRSHEIANRSEAQVAYGVMESSENMSKLHYLAGAPVNKAEVLPEGMAAWVIEAKAYAVFETTLSELSTTFDTIFGTWLPNSDYLQGSGPLLERYGEDFDPQEHPILSIYIPVKSKA